MDQQRSRSIRAGHQLARLLKNPVCSLERLADRQRRLLPEEYANRPLGEPSEALTPAELLKVYRERAGLGQELFSPADRVQQLRAGKGLITEEAHGGRTEGRARPGEAGHAL